MRDFSQNSAYMRLPLKNVAVALLFAVVLGPIGLLYASYWGGVVLIVLGFFVLASQLKAPIIILWIICCIWAVGATNRYNRKLLKGC